MTETQEAVADMVLSDRFRNELSRIRLDLGVSPHLPISDEMCKWVVLAYLRSTQECATNSKREPVATLNEKETVEPVAWMVYTLDGQSAFVTDNPADFTPQHRALPLYTAPPKREPLTDAQIMEIFINSGRSEKTFARAIERAHDIGG